MECRYLGGDWISVPQTPRDSTETQDVRTILDKLECTGQLLLHRQLQEYKVPVEIAMQKERDTRYEMLGGFKVCSLNFALVRPPS